VRADHRLGDPFAATDHAEAGREMEAQARGVLREEAGLDGPVALVVRLRDEGGEQRRPDPVARALRAT